MTNYSDNGWRDFSRHKSNPSLTDDDVLEDVGVVVRCGCHLDTVRGNRKQQRTGMIHNSDVVFLGPHPAWSESVPVRSVCGETLSAETVINLAAG